MTLCDDEGDPVEDKKASLWGIESDCHDFHEEVAKELAAEVLNDLRADIEMA